MAVIDRIMNKNPAPSSYILVGKIGSTFGVRGWIKIRSYTEYGPSLLDHSTWLVEKANELVPMQVEAGRVHGPGLIVKFANIETPEEARLLTGKAIYLNRKDLPQLKKGEYYWSDLVGLTVINQKNEVLGKVIYLIATGSNDVLVIKNDREHAIPYLPGEVILEVNLEKREIHVNWDLL